MSDYIATLEKQNEELKELLAKEQALSAWRDARHVNKLRFFYKFEWVTQTDTGIMISNISLNKEETRNCIRKLRATGPQKIFDIVPFKFEGKVIRIRFYCKVHGGFLRSEPLMRRSWQLEIYEGSFL